MIGLITNICCKLSRIKIKSDVFIQFSSVQFHAKGGSGLLACNEPWSYVPICLLPRAFGIIDVPPDCSISSSVFTSLQILNRCEHRGHICSFRQCSQHFHLSLQHDIAAEPQTIYALRSYGTSSVLLKKRQPALPFHSCCEIPSWDHLQHENESCYIFLTFSWSGR